MKNIITIILSFILWGCDQTAEDAKNLDFEKHEDSGVRVLDDYVGNPDSQGVFEVYKLDFPVFDKGVYYSADWWPVSSNRVYGNIIDEKTIPDVKEGGMFLLLRLSPNKYLAVLPMASELAYSWFDTSADGLVLKMGNHGKGAIEGDIPLYSWSFSDDPYGACKEAWEIALDFSQNTTTMREKKAYPEVFEYLGWCSWEHYKAEINEVNMVKAIQDIERSEVPIRYFLMDDGHFDRLSIMPGENFPNGYKPLTSLKKKDKIKWMGIWYAFLGDNHGIKSPGKLGELGEHMTQSHAGILLPGEEGELSEKFFDYILDVAIQDDMDFVKVDFQTDPLVFYAGNTHPAPVQGRLPSDNSLAVDNPVKASVRMSEVFQQRISDKSLPLMNCNWHHSIPLFYSGESSVGRCSEDYVVGDKDRAKAHLYHSYAATPWIGQIAWGDHDMFHSNDPFAGRMMAVSKAVSGAPIYLSDEPNDFNPDNISPLSYVDGKLIRPEAPATPLPDHIFQSMDEDALYSTITPLKNASATVVVYNLSPSENKLVATIDSTYYTSASAMVQPYPGEWEIPEEGILVYDWYHQSAQLLKDGHDVTIEGFGDHLLHLIPIKNGWGIIGRADKYLSPATYTVLETSDKSILLELEEEGPLVIWSEGKTPFAEGIKFERLNDNLWKADMPVKKGKKIVHIRK